MRVLAHFLSSWNCILRSISRGELEVSPQEEHEGCESGTIYLKGGMPNSWSRRSFQSQEDYQVFSDLGHRWCFG